MLTLLSLYGGLVGNGWKFQTRLLPTLALRLHSVFHFVHWNLEKLPQSYPILSLRTLFRRLHIGSLFSLVLAIHSKTHSHFTGWIVNSTSQLPYLKWILFPWKKSALISCNVLKVLVEERNKRYRFRKEIPLFLNK